MTAVPVLAPPTAPVQPVEARIAVAASVPVGAVHLDDRAAAGEWGWRVVTVVLGPIADRNPDIALTILRTADELVDNGRGWVQRLIGLPALG